MSIREKSFTTSWYGDVVYLSDALELEGEVERLKKVADFCEDAHASVVQLTDHYLAEKDAEIERLNREREADLALLRACWTTIHNRNVNSPLLARIDERTGREGK